MPQTSAPGKQQLSRDALDRTLSPHAVRYLTLVMRGEPCQIKPAAGWPSSLTARQRRLYYT
jgi:hypothetical protein